MVRTELHEAAKKGDLEKVKDLVENKGFNVEERETDDSEYTPLLCAATNGRAEVVRYLVEQGKAKVGAKDTDGWTPLHQAAFKGHLQVVKCLVEQGKANVKTTNDDVATALHVAASKEGSLEVVRYLVEEAHADVEVTDWYGQTAYDRATKADIKEYLKNVMEGGEGGLTMTKSAAFKKEEE